MNEQKDNKNIESKNKGFNFDLEDDNFRIEDQGPANPYETGNNNKIENKMEDNGSNKKNEDDEWNF